MAAKSACFLKLNLFNKITEDMFSIFLHPTGSKGPIRGLDGFGTTRHCRIQNQRVPSSHLWAFPKNRGFLMYPVPPFFAICEKRK